MRPFDKDSAPLDLESPPSVPPSAERMENWMVPGTFAMDETSWTPDPPATADAMTGSALRRLLITPEVLAAMSEDDAPQPKLLDRLLGRKRR
ncbi:hypothetical protein ACQEPB_09480 [Novosphingobium fluoreni]|uniref:hypothetical protein n=1 Tax=Novosphingobium fluoreni TaxID=1391222 RepID=UPI00128F988B